MNTFLQLKKTRVFAMLFALALGITATASAEVLVTFATRANNFNTTGSNVAVPLDDAAKTSLSFNTKAANKIVKITYNAECGVIGPAQSWLSVRVLVDGVDAAPASGNLFGFCSSTSASSYAWVGATRQVIYKVPTAGAHTVQVIANLNAGATSGWLGDTSIVIEQK